MKRLKIAIDVDLTVVDTLSSWMDWIGILPHPDVISTRPESIDGLYNHWMNSVYGVDPDGINEYWKKSDLYDNLDPLPYSVESITQLQNNHDLFFLSSCHDEHIDSKRRFLAKHFPGIDLIPVKMGLCKSIHEFDVIVDDNPKVLADIRSNIERVGIDKQPILIITNQITPWSLKNTHHEFINVDDLSEVVSFIERLTKPKLLTA